MNILFLHSAGDTYGSGRIMWFTIRSLIGAGHRCTVILPEHGPLAKELEEIGARVQIYELGILRRKYFTIIGLINRTAALALAVVRIVSLIRREKTDIVYSNTTAVLAGALAARMTGRRHFWHVHEILATPRPFVKMLAFLLQRFSDRVIVVSQAVYDHWNALRPMSGQLVLIHNGLDDAPFSTSQADRLRKELHLSDSSLIVGMVGRVHYWKGQGYFLEIARRLHSEFPHLRFVMVGDPFPGYEYLLTELRERIVNFGLTEVVIDLGFRRDIIDIMAGLDIFVLPSTLPDPLPTVVLEAMFSGKPVVATNHGGAREMVEDGRTGILIPWDNAEEAASKMKTLVQNETMRKEMGKDARFRAISHFSLESYERHILSLFS